MKTKIIFKSLSVLLLLVLSSCVTTTINYDRVYRPSSYAMLNDGYWGDWKKLYYDYLNDYHYKVQTQYNSQTLEILIYYKGNHPSAFTAKIVIDKRTGKQQDADWATYQGTITAKRVPLYLDNIYSVSRYGDNNYHTIKCTVNCDKEMQKAIQKNGLVGTINIYYGDGKGDAISFK